MNDTLNIEKLKNLSFTQLKEKVSNIRGQLPKEKRKIITYSKNFTLSLSNYCQNQCGYCFYNYKVPKLSGEGNVILLENEKMRMIIQKGLEFDCKEALLMSGERPDTFLEVQDALRTRNCNDYIEFIKDICTYVLDFNILPHTNIGVLTFEELKEIKSVNASMGLMLESTSLELFKKGGVHEHSPTKHPDFRIKHIKDAGKLKIPFTTGLLVGIGENFEERVKDLLLIKKIHDKYDHIQEVIIQNFQYKEGISYKPEKPILMKEVMKIVGIAKLIFLNDVAIQVPPNLIFGYEKEFIELGVNDFGGISPLTLDYINPESPWPNIIKLREKCEILGYKLKERLAVYDKYLDKEDFCPETIKSRINNINLNANDTIV